MMFTVLNEVETAGKQKIVQTWDVLNLIPLKRNEGEGKEANILRIFNLNN